jgi:hypothetical protein
MTSILVFFNLGAMYDGIWVDVQGLLLRTNLLRKDLRSLDVAIMCQKLEDLGRLDKVN